MKLKITNTAIAAALLTLLGHTAGAANAVGYNKITVPANSDVLVSVPFNEDAAGTYSVSSISSATISVNETLAADTFDNTYYVRITSGNAAGLWSTVSSNAAGELTVQDEDILSDVTAGDTLDVLPHHTLETVLPDRLVDVSFIASTGSGFSLTINTTVRTWSADVGINQSPANTYYYHESGEWRTLAGGNADATIFTPDDIMVIRNSDDTEALSYIVSGNVPEGAIGQLLSTHASDDDTYTSSGRPVGITLDELGLGGSAAFKGSTGSGFSLTINDTLRVYDNTTAGINKSPASTYYYHETEGWRTLADAPAGDTVIPAGTGFVIRKVSGTTSTDAWTAQAPY